MTVFIPLQIGLFVVQSLVNNVTKVHEYSLFGEPNQTSIKPSYNYLVLHSQSQGFERFRMILQEYFSNIQHRIFAINSFDFCLFFESRMVSKLLLSHALTELQGLDQRSLSIYEVLDSQWANLRGEIDRFVLISQIVPIELFK